MKHVKPWHVLIVGWVLFLFHAYPGLMTRDSFDQLAQARSGIYYDDHPPLMQLILGITNRLISGPFGFIVLQSAMLLGGAYLLARRVMSDRPAAIVAVAFMWFPPVVAVMTVLWKDPIMAGALLLATALIISPRRRWRLVALALVMVATGVRFNALAATFSIVVLLFEWREVTGGKWRQRALRYGLALGVWAALTGITFGINAALADREAHFFEGSLVGDIVGTLNFVEGERTDTSLKRALAGTNLIPQQDVHEALRKSYRSESATGVIEGPDRVFDLVLDEQNPPTPEQRQALIRAWKTIVPNNVGAYLRYRVDQFRLLLGLTTDVEDVWDRPIIVTHEFQNKPALTEAGIPSAVSPFQSAIDAVLTWFSHGPLFRPYVYFAISLLLLWPARKNQMALSLLLSGIGIELSMFFLARSMDYRYSHWLVCTTLLACVLLFIDRRFARRHGRPFDLRAQNRELANDVG
jgi:hypothetical protein